MAAAALPGRCAVEGGDVSHKGPQRGRQREGSPQFIGEEPNVKGERTGDDYVIKARSWTREHRGRGIDWFSTVQQ